MALRDAEKEALEWAQLVPAAVRVIGDLSDSDDVRRAADALAALPVGAPAQELARPHDGRAAWGTFDEVVAEAILEAEPWTLIYIEDDDGRRFPFLVSHWLEA